MPHAPSVAPTRHEELTFGVQIGLSYPALSGVEAGGADILSYNVAVDLSGGGSGPWTTNPQGSESDDASLIAVLQPLAEGQLFYFKYRAKNAHGWGPYSPIMAVRMANKPDQLAPATVTNVGTMVEIDWNPTPNDRNSEVFEYRIKIKRSDGTFVEHPECDGSDQSVIDNTVCNVSMASLLEADFWLNQGDEIKVTVEAMNQIDYSLPSEVAGTALVQTKPHAPL